LAVYQRIGAIRTLGAALALVAAMTGCDAGWPDLSLDPGPGGSVSRTVEGCPVTLPTGEPPFEGEDFNYGNPYLAVALWTRGRLVADRVPGTDSWAEVAPDGSIRAKVGWRRGVSGRLTIQGERLDADAPPLRARVPGGYGHTGFQSTELRFPTAGCWKVVGSVAGHDIEFIVRVTKRRGWGPRAAQASPAQGWASAALAMRPVAPSSAPADSSAAVAFATRRPVRPREPRIATEALSSEPASPWTRS
jgi:hypothetical protein